MPLMAKQLMSLRRWEVFLSMFPDTDDPTQLLENDAGWKEDAGFVVPRLIATWVLYRGEPTVLKLSVTRTPLEVIKTGCELLSSKVALSFVLEKLNLKNMTPKQRARRPMQSWRRSIARPPRW